MGNMPDNIDAKVPLDLRDQVDHALAYQPPGLETYEKVYNHFKLADYGVGIKTVERRGMEKRNEVKAALSRRLLAIKELRAAVTGGIDVDAATAELLYAELFEHMVSADRDPKTIEKLSGAIRSLVAANIARQAEKRAAELFAAKARAAAEAVARSEQTAESAEHALNKLRADIRMIYGVGEVDDG